MICSFCHEDGTHDEWCQASGENIARVVSAYLAGREAGLTILRRKYGEEAVARAMAEARGEADS